MLSINVINGQRNGVRTPNFGNIKHFERAVGMIDASYDGLASRLLKGAGNIDDLFDKKHSLPGKFFENLIYPFTELPKGIFNATLGKFTKLFPENKTLKILYNAGFLLDFRQSKVLKQQHRALKGLLQHADKSIEATGENQDLLIKRTDELIGKAFESKYGNYNTRDERGLNRFITSLIPAFFLGADAHNIAKNNGKNDKEAKQAEKGKRNQEIVSTFTESLMTFSTTGTFDKFINNNQFGAPIIGAISSVVGHILSRLSTNRPITPLRAKPESTSNSSDSIEHFVKSLNKTESQEDKKPLLTLKNLFLFCVASVGAGFTLKYSVRNLLKSAQIKNKVNAFKSWYEKLTMKELRLKKDDLNQLFESIEQSENKKLSDRYAKRINFQTEEYFILGKVEKAIEVPFLKQEVPLKELLKVPALPFKILFEFLSYPYKAVQKIFAGLGSIKKLKDGKIKSLLNELGSRAIEKKPSKNEFEDLLNIYTDFIKQKSKFKDDNNFQEFYSKHFNEKILQALDSETVSKVDNTQIGKMTQLLTMAVSLYFAATDDYNQVINETNNLDKAEKTARTRLVQKMTRIVTQIGMIDVFNNIFKAQYNASLFGATTVAGICTLATDSATRFLMGQPILRHSTDELKELKQAKEEGIAGGYYRVINKLSE